LRVRKSFARFFGFLPESKKKCQIAANQQEAKIAGTGVFQHDKRKQGSSLELAHNYDITFSKVCARSG